MQVPRGRPEAIVSPSAAAPVLSIERLAPSPELADLVDYYWFVGWDAVRPHRQQVIPQPRVHVAAEDDRLMVHPVTRRTFFRTLAGRGHVLGAAFLPGGFRPLLGRSVATLAGEPVPAGTVFEADDRRVARQVLQACEVAQMVAAMEGYLVGLLPRGGRLDPDQAAVVAHVTALVAHAEQHRSVTRAEQLAEHAGTSLRSLQRLFSEYVGVGPKWVVQRCRVLDAAGAAHSGEDVDWASLAGELGFSDQAHLTRVFSSVVGTPPAAYRRHA